MAIYQYQAIPTTPNSDFLMIYVRAIFFFYNSKRKEKIRRPMSNSYLMFSDITGYKTILYETKASIYEKAIEAILDSINGIIIIIGHIIMICIAYF